MKQTKTSVWLYFTMFYMMVSWMAESLFGVDGDLFTLIWLVSVIANFVLCIVHLARGVKDKTTMVITSLVLSSLLVLLFSIGIGIGVLMAVYEMGIGVM